MFICTAVQIILWLFAQVHCRAAFTLSSRLPLFVYTLQLTVDTVPCLLPCHLHCGGQGCYQHQLPQCQWQAAQLCQPHFTSDCWYIFSRSQGRFGTFFSKSFYQLLEADGEDTSLVFSPTPSLLGDHCMRVLHLAEPNFAWGQQPKPHGYSPVGQKEMMVTGVSENTTLFSFLSGKYCLSSVYLLDISHHPQTPQTWRRTA